MFRVLSWFKDEHRTGRLPQPLVVVTPSDKQLLAQAIPACRSKPVAIVAANALDPNNVLSFCIFIGPFQFPR
jgi:hypothetical protein